MGTHSTDACMLRAPISLMRAAAHASLFRSTASPHVSPLCSLCSNAEDDITGQEQGQAQVYRGEQQGDAMRIQQRQRIQRNMCTLTMRTLNNVMRYGA